MTRERSVSSSSPGLFDRWSLRLLPALVGLVPLFFMLNMEDTFDLPKLVLVYGTGLVLLSLWFGQVLSRKEIQFRPTPLDSPLLIFIVVTGLSAWFSIDPSLSLFGAYKIYVFGTLPLAGFALLFWLTAQTDVSELRKSAVTAAQWSGALVGLYAVLQFSGNELFDRMPLVKGGRPWSSLGNPLYLGALCMMALPLALTELIESRQHRFSTFLLAVFMTLGLVLSLSRSAWLGTLCALAVVGAHYGRRAVAAASAVLVAVGVCALVFSPVRQRLSGFFSLQDSSNVARVEGWKSGLKVWRRYPWLGSGPDTFSQAFRPFRSLAYVRATGSGVTQGDAHNDLIQVAATQGSLGLLAMLGVLWMFFRTLRKGFGETKIQLGLLAGLAALIVQNQFNFSSVATSAWAAVWAGLLLGVSGRREGSEVRVIPLSAAPVLRGALILLMVLCPLGIAASVRPLWADIGYKQGLIFLQGNQPLQALEYFRNAVKWNAHYELYSMQHANAARDVARFSADPGLRQALFVEAWDAATTASRKHPHNPDAWNNRGVAAMWLTQLSGQDYWDEARRSFERAVELDPVFVDAWANLAKWQHLRGDLKAEKELWSHVLKIDPQHSMAQQVLGTRAK